MADNKFGVDYAKRQAGCKKCKQKIEKGELRLAKITASPFSDDGEMRNYHHPACLFETFKRARASTKVIEEPGDIEGWDDLNDSDKAAILSLIKEGAKGTGPTKAACASTPKKRASSEGSKGNSSKPKKQKKDDAKNPTKKKSNEEEDIAYDEDTRDGANESSSSSGSKREPQGDPNHKDNSFREFRRLCASIAEESSYNAKIEIIRKFFAKGSDGDSFKGDLYVWVHLLLPGESKAKYNVQSKQLIKLFARIFGASEDKMLEDLEKGDVAETISTFMDKSSRVKEAKKSKLTVHDVFKFLADLTRLTKEDEQQEALTKIIKECTINDLKMIIRLIKKDLRMQAGVKHVLGGLHEEAYDAYRKSSNLGVVVDRIAELRKNGDASGSLELAITLMSPVKPMLAMACKSVEEAFTRCPNGIFAEIKYDGERVQLHKKGDSFKCFSRNLKPVLPHKVKLIQDFIPEAFPDGSDLILDAEVLMVDNATGAPLPFGTLGIYKGAGFKDASPCLFVFDCLYYNGESLMSKPIRERRKFLLDHMVEVKNRIKFSEATEIKKKRDLELLITKVLSEGLEGLVLKDYESTYEPGKRYWLKIKKDYLNEGAMADSADLVVLGAWFGTGKRGSIMSIFLMGCYCGETKNWRTVTKVHSGYDEATLDRLQEELAPNMVKIKQDASKVPEWLSCTRQMTPDFVVKDPKKSPVWEITGAEFTKSEIHTADGISIRFPRVTRMRPDKDWKSATNLSELVALFAVSRANPARSSAASSSAEDASGLNTDGSSTLNNSFSSRASVEDLETSTSVVYGEHSFSKVRIEAESGFVLECKRGDLFSAGADASLAHCVSEDLKMGKGIAKLFKEKFAGLKTLDAKSAKVGGVLVAREGKRFIYNLVTKPTYADKPTYESLRQSLEAMRAHVEEHGVEKVAMPKIGCGLDGLQWNAVRTLVKNVFLHVDVRIQVFFVGADEPEELHPSPVKHAKALARTPKKQQTIVNMLKPEVSPGTPSKKAKVDSVKDEGLQLEDIFDGCRVHIMGDVADKRLQRYVIAYGGEVVSDDDIDTATHIIHAKKGPKRKPGAKGAVHLSDAWLKDSIRAKAAQKVESYAV